MRENVANIETPEAGQGSPLGVHPIVMCRVEWEHHDGRRIRYMEKWYRLPCWLNVGMRISSDVLCCGQKVESASVNLERCEQWVYLTKRKHDTPEELDETVASLLEDGWIVESEDSYT